MITKDSKKEQPKIVIGEASKKASYLVAAEKLDKLMRDTLKLGASNGGLN